MKKWEYHTVIWPDDKPISPTLNELGTDGWELCTMDRKIDAKKNTWMTIAFFKRELSA